MASGNSQRRGGDEYWHRREAYSSERKRSVNPNPNPGPLSDVSGSVRFYQIRVTVGPHSKNSYWKTKVENIDCAWVQVVKTEPKRRKFDSGWSQPSMSLVIWFCMEYGFSQGDIDGLAFLSGIVEKLLQVSEFDQKEMADEMPVNNR